MSVIFSRKMILATLLVVAAMALMVRLGFWQLDRLSQRRASNQVILAQLNSPQLNLNQALAQDNAVETQLAGMQYRSVLVRGTYDFAQQVGLANQVWSDQLGYDLLTPLRISGSNLVVLVDRGWVSKADFEAGRLAQYDQSAELMIQGVILDSQTHPSLGRMQDPPYNPAQRTATFYVANLPRIAQELPYPLLPIYIQQTPDPAKSGPPYRKPFSLVVNDGPHLSYAIQWFSFTLILGIGYPILVMRNTRKVTRLNSSHQSGT